VYFEIGAEFGPTWPAIWTTGFEDYDDPAIANSVPPEATFAAPESPMVPVESEPAPAFVIEPAAKPSALAFEAIEVMDYEDEDSGYFFEEEIQPEPEVPPPPFAAPVPLAPVQPAAPARAKLQPGPGPAAFAPAETVLPEIPLRTLRPKLLRGKNPFVPEPKPEPVAPPPMAEAMAAPKPGAVESAAASSTVKPAPVPPAPKKPEINVRPAFDKDRKRTPPPPPAVSRPVVAARDRGNAVPVERDEPVAAPPPPQPVPTPAAAPKPKVMEMPSRKPEAAPEPASVVAAQSTAAPSLGMPEPTSGMSGGVKIGIAAAVLAVVLGGGVFMFSGGKTSAKEAAGESISDTPSSLIVGGGGWTTTWGIDAPINKGKQISIYRPSMAMTDYRFEFRGQIERKSLGWIFRAANPKNYYVMKLETIKPGANPLVALVKYAVIDGKETTRTQVMLPFEVKLDTLYQVRLDVRGDKFSTYVQGKLVDFWTDNRVKLGGAGFYSDAGERAAVKTSQLSYLASAGK
jgi:hypothetical protein